MCSQIPVEPVEGRHDRSWLVTQTLYELHCEVAVQGSGPKRSQNILHGFRGPIAETQKPIRHL